MSCSRQHRGHFRAANSEHGRARARSLPAGTADSGAVGSVVRAHKNAVPNVRREPVFDVNVLRGGVA